MVGVCKNRLCGRRNEPIHSILNSIPETIELVKSGYDSIIRGKRDNMTDNGFSRKGLEREVAQGNLNVEAKARGKFSKENLKQLIDYQHKTNVIQCIIAVVLILLGIIINIVKKNTQWV